MNEKLPLLKEDLHKKWKRDKVSSLKNNYELKKTYYKTIFPSWDKSTSDKKILTKSQKISFWLNFCDYKKNRTVCDITLHYITDKDLVRTGSDVEEYFIKNKQK